MATVRDVNKRAFIDRLASYLRATQTIKAPNHVPLLTDDQMIPWWYNQAACLIHQIYLHPSVAAQRAPMKGRRIENRVDQIRQSARINMLQQFTERGWIINDKCGIILVTKGGQREMDDIAADIMNECSNK